MRVGIPIRSRFAVVPGTAVTDGSSHDWTELLDWLKLVLRLLVVGGVSYFVLTKTTKSR